MTRRNVTNQFGAIACATMMIGCATAVAGDTDNLSGEALKRAISGRTVRLDTPMGGLPIAFRADGTMSATAGTLASYTGSERDQGRWWVSGDKLCKKWNVWMKSQQYCFTLQQTGKNVAWRRNDGVSGSATILR